MSTTSACFVLFSFLWKQLFSENLCSKQKNNNCRSCTLSRLLAILKPLVIILDLNLMWLAGRWASASDAAKMLLLFWYVLITKGTISSFRPELTKFALDLYGIICLFVCVCVNFYVYIISRLLFFLKTSVLLNCLPLCRWFELHWAVPHWSLWSILDYEDNLKNRDDIKIWDDLQNDDNNKNYDDRKVDDWVKMKTYSKMKTTSKIKSISIFYPTPHKKNKGRFLTS